MAILDVFSDFKNSVVATLAKNFVNNNWPSKMTNKEEKTYYNGHGRTSNINNFSA